MTVTSLSLSGFGQGTRGCEFGSHSGCVNLAFFIHIHKPAHWHATVNDPKLLPERWHLYSVFLSSLAAVSGRLNTFSFQVSGVFLWSSVTMSWRVLGWCDQRRDQIQGTGRASSPDSVLLFLRVQRGAVAADTELKWAANRSVRDSSLVTAEQRSLPPFSEGGWKHEECQAPIFPPQSDATKEAEPPQEVYSKVVTCIFQNPAQFSSII